MTENSTKRGSKWDRITDTEDSQRHRSDLDIRCSDKTVKNDLNNWSPGSKWHDAETVGIKDISSRNDYCNEIKEKNTMVSIGQKSYHDWQHPPSKNGSPKSGRRSSR